MSPLLGNLLTPEPVLSPRQQRWQDYLEDLDLRQVLRDLALPHQLMGREARFTCPVHGKAGSMTGALRLDGEKKGLWHCWHPGCEVRGSLVRLVMLTMECEREEAEDFLGFHDEDRLPKAFDPVPDRLAALRERLETARTTIQLVPRSGGSPPPPPSLLSQKKCSLPGQDTPETRRILSRYLASPVRGFAEPERVIDRHGLRVSHWETVGEQKLPGLRVVMPMQNALGTVTYWGARAIDMHAPKMLYPRDYPLYHHLLGEDLLPAWQAEGVTEIALVEGPWDWAKLLDLGVPAVASFSAQIYAQQALTLFQSGMERVLLAYDGDEAGRRGTWRAWSRLSGDLDVVRVLLPAGLDPGNLNTFAQWQALPRRAMTTKEQ